MVINRDGGKLLDSYLKEDKPKRLHTYVTKILWCLIFLFASLIFTSVNEKCLNLYKKYVFEDTFPFMEFQNFYEKLSSSGNQVQDKMVFGSSLEYTNITSYQNGQSLEIGTAVPINNLTGGIVVFSGEKEGFNKTVIIQGSDGYDIWYGNLENVSSFINVFRGQTIYFILLIALKDDMILEGIEKVASKLEGR